MRISIFLAGLTVAGKCANLKREGVQVVEGVGLGSNLIDLYENILSQNHPS